MTTSVDIVLADAQATPVNHTFTALGQDNDRIARFVENNVAAAAIGSWSISVDIKNPPAPKPGESSRNRVRRVKVTLTEPVLETLGTSDAGYMPAPTVAFIPRAIVEFVLPEQSTLQHRKDLRKMIASLLTNAQITAAVENGISLT